MAQGPKLPLEVVNGRLVLLAGDDYIEQLVFIGLLGGYSENPFQELGLGEFMIFGINDGMSEGEIQTRIEGVFALLERDQLAKLEDPGESIKFSRREGEMFAEITYVNMETQERPEIEVPIPPA